MRSCPAAAVRRSAVCTTSTRRSLVSSDELVTYAKNFGHQSEVYNGVDLALNLRLPGGVVLQGGTRSRAHGGRQL